MILKMQCNKHLWLLARLACLLAASSFAPDVLFATASHAGNTTVLDTRTADGDAGAVVIKAKVASGPPFANDGYEWPTVYEEADDMLDASLLMYPMAELRKMARHTPEKFSDPAAILKEPSTATEIEAILSQNMGVLKASFGEESSDIIDDALDAIIERQRSARKTAHRAPTAILAEFNDDNSHAELVYAIGVDNAMKRVTLSFRGSVTKTDFLTDAQIWMEDVPNPMAELDKKQPKKIGIHNGFRDYLFYETTTGETRQDSNEVKTKYEIILDQVVRLLNKHPGYKLYVTGHSLGAALSSLFAFMAASTREDIPKPVTCVSIASPYVGDGRWRKAFQFAEMQGKIRYLRVANSKDVVTLMPFLSLRLRLYKHVGVSLKLYQNKHVLSYPKVGMLFALNKLRRVWTNSLFANPSLIYLKNHGCKEYNARLDQAMAHLDSIYLNDIYADTSTTGNLLRGLEL